MSASQNKKKRQAIPADNAMLSEFEQQAQDSKKFRKRAMIGLAAVAVVVLFVLIFNSNLFYNKVTAVNIDGTKYTVADYNYYYVTEYNDYYNSLVDAVGETYAKSYLPDAARSMRDQIFDEATGETWADYLKGRTLDKMAHVTSVCNDADKAGFTLSDAKIAAIDTEMMNIEYYALLMGYANTQSYLEYIYGKGMNIDVYRENYTRMTLASEYAAEIYDSYSYDDEAKDAEYKSSPDSYDYVKYASMFFYAQTDTMDRAQAMEKAKSDAKSFAGKVSNEDEFASENMQYILQNPAYYNNTLAYDSKYVRGDKLPGTFGSWLLDPARENGDIEIFEYTQETTGTVDGYYAIMYLERDNNDYASVNGYYMLTAPAAVSRDTYTNDTDYNAAVADADAAAAEAAQTIIDEWDNGEYDTLSKLAAQHAYNLADYSVLEHVGKHDENDTISAWLFDETRQEGDSAVLYSAGSGYYTVFYTGTDDVYYRVCADAALRDAEYNAWEQELAAECDTDTAWVMTFAGKMSSMGA